MGKEDNFLTRIMRERRKDSHAAEREVSRDELLWEREKRLEFHSLAAQLCDSRVPRVIAEIKRASPSAGVLRQVCEPAAIAKAYEAAGAIGISVLTEPRHFLGAPGDIRSVRKVTALPILRKDFISEPYQVAEAAAWGADVVLLIVAALDPGRCELLFREACELSLETIVEVHTAGDLKTALACEGAIIGVNSRDLKTLQTDLAVAYELVKAIPNDRLCIAESGIKTREDILGLQAAGYDGFLIGESLLREESPGRALKALREG